MVYIGLTPTDFVVKSQFENCNVTIILGSSNVNVNIYGNIKNNNTILSISSNIILGGNLGIGTTLPTHRVHVYSTDNSKYESSSIFLENATNGELGIAFRNSNIESTNMFYMGINNTDNRFDIGYGIQSQEITESPDFSILPNGNVGIGTSYAFDKFHVSGGNFVFPQAGAENNMINGGLQFIDFNTNTIKYYAYPNTGTTSPNDNRGTIWSVVDNKAIRFNTGNSIYPVKENMCILGNGNIGIGTTDPVQECHINRICYFTENVGIGRAASPRQKLDVLGHTYFNGNVGINTTIPLYSLHLSIDSAAKPTTNTWTTSSDERLKTNIVNADLDKCWSNIQQLPLHNYTWRKDIFSSNEVLQGNRIGWIAQNVEPYFPKSIEVKPLHGLPDCKILNTDQIYASMFGALQKAMETVELYEKQIAELLTKLS